MEDTNTENLDSTNETADNDTDITIDDTLDADAKVAVLEDRNRKLFERAKKAEGFTKQSDGSWVKKEKPQPKQDSTLTESKSAPDTRSLYEQVSLLKNLEQDEMNELESEAKDLGVDVVKYLKSNSGKNHLATIRKERKSKEASPEIANASPILRKYTQNDISNMSAAELERAIKNAQG
jgi:hypothetical protein